jgi:hypothetical protein
VSQRRHRSPRWWRGPGGVAGGGTAGPFGRGAGRAGRLRWRAAAGRGIT